MAFVKFEENRFRIDGEIAENHAILVNLTASINVSLFNDSHKFTTCMTIVPLNLPWTNPHRKDGGPWITRVYIRFTRGNQFFFNQAVNEIISTPRWKNANNILLFFLQMN